MVKDYVFGRHTFSLAWHKIIMGGVRLNPSTRFCQLFCTSVKRDIWCDGLPEMSGLWKFSLRFQPWSDKIESDPVLIRQCKIMYLYFATWGKRTTEAILPLAKYDWLKAKYFHQCFCLMRQNTHNLLALPKFSKQVSIRHQRQKHCWSYDAIRRVRLLGLTKRQGQYTWISIRSFLHDQKS